QIDSLVANAVCAFAAQDDRRASSADASREEMPFVCRHTVETPEVIARAHRSETTLDEAKPDDLVAADHGARRTGGRSHLDPASQQLRTTRADFVQDMTGVAAG